MSSNSGSDLKTLKKGEVLYKPGDNASHLYLIQSGLISVSLIRQGKTIELYQAIPPQFVGEEALHGLMVFETTAIAVNNDTRVTEVPIEKARYVIEAMPAVAKLLAKSMISKNQSFAQDLRAIRLDADTTPCPPENIAKLFAVIFHVATQIGDKKNDVVKVNWPYFRKYAQRVFSESPIRLEQGINLLVKIGYAKHEMIKSETDPDAPDELGFVHFNKLPEIEAFSNFYRRFHYEGFNDRTMIQSYQKFFAEIEAWNRLGKVQLGEDAA